MFAHEERDHWHEELSNGRIPDHVRASVNTYQRLRNNPTWRSSGLLESLGEAASVLLELLDKGTIVIPNNKEIKLIHLEASTSTH